MGREAGRGAGADGGGPPPAAGSKAESLRDRVSSAPSSSSRPRARPSCWGGIRIRRVRRSRSGAGGGEHDAAPAVRTASTSRVCGGRADAAAGARSLLQRNDFYCDDCNTHR